MKMKKLNNDLQHVRVGEDDRVPIETHPNLWFLWITKSGVWDAERITRLGSILTKIKDDDVQLIFCNWHGNYKTDLFLMDKNKLIKRFERMCKKG